MTLNNNRKSMALTPPYSHRKLLRRKPSGKFKHFIYTAFIMCLIQQFTFAQTAQSIPYTQNFGTSTFTAMPAGTATCTVTTSPATTLAEAEASTTNVTATVTAATAANSTGGSYGYAVSSNGSFYIQTSSNGTSGSNQLIAAINTVGQTNVSVSYDVQMISANQRIVGLVVQYRIGTTGSWTTISGSVYAHNNADRTNGAVDSYNGLTLPAVAMNNSTVQIRWASWRGAESGNSSGIAIDNISIVSAGVTGPTGPTGAQGIAGVTGVTGTQGIAGTNGINGATGATGATGADGSANAWGKTGTAGTDPTVNFIGTSDSVDLVLKSNNVERLRVKANGNVYTPVGESKHMTIGEEITIGTDATVNGNLILPNLGNGILYVVGGIVSPTPPMGVNCDESSPDPDEAWTTLGNNHILCLGVIGNKNARPLAIITNNTQRMYFSETGNITFPGKGQINNDGSWLIGPANSIAATGYKLSVKGKIITEEVRVLNYSEWPDYVFENSFKLNSISEIELFIKQHKHLPGMPAASEVEKNGFDLGNMIRLQQEQIEKQMLYIIELEKRLKTVEVKN